jgi:hypothetical protein
MVNCLRGRDRHAGSVGVMRQRTRIGARLSGGVATGYTKRSHSFGGRGPAESRCGEMSEWLKEHAWKACVRETVPWVRIPLSPPEYVFLYVKVTVNRITPHSITHQVR